MKNPICCSIESVYVDNIPGKEYWYCRQCKQEVMPFKEYQALEDQIEQYFRDQTPSFVYPGLDTDDDWDLVDYLDNKITFKAFLVGGEWKIKS